MKKLNVLAIALVASGAASATGTAQESRHRFSFSAQAVFNASLKFQSDRMLPVVPASRITPDGDPYNYDNGYLLTDISGNMGGLTWYWGYDDAGQVVGDTIQFSRATPGTDLTADSIEDTPALGGELLYNYDLCDQGPVKFGIEAGVSFFEMVLNENIAGFGTVSRVTDAYPFTSGTTPPQAPYAGTFTGPGFTLGDTPVSSQTSILNGALVSTERHLEARVWGGRFGPSMDISATDHLKFTLSGGAAMALVDTSASVVQNVTIPGMGSGQRSGSSDDLDFLIGPYIAGSVRYDFAEDWSVRAGLQYSYLGEARDSFGGSSVEVDLSDIVAATLGVSYSF